MINIKALLIFFLLLSFAHGKEEYSPKVIDGVINLENYNFKKSGPAKIKGNWNFYWNKFLKPEDLNEDLFKKTKKISVPGLWNANKNFKAYGYGSLFTKVTGLKKGEKLSIQLQGFSSSFKLFIIQDNKSYFLGGVGTPGTKKSNTTPKFGDLVRNFTSTGSDLYILIHGANFHYRTGGLFNSVAIGNKQDIREKSEGVKYRSFFIIGIYLIIGINHFGIFYQRREDKGSFWFGIFCFIIVFRFLSAKSYLDYIFPNPSVFSFELNRKFEFLTFYLGGPIFCEFLRYLFKDYFPDKFMKTFWITSGLFSAVVLLTSSNIFSLTINAFQIIVLFFILFILIQILRASIKNIPYSRICMAGLSVFMFGIIWDILVENSILPPPRLAIATSVIFVFIQSYIISKKFSYAYEIAEALRKDLSKKIDERTKEIAMLLHSMQNSVFHIDKDLNVIPPVSKYSEIIFKKNIENKNIFDFLFESVKQGSRSDVEYHSTFTSIFGQEKLNYDFIEGNFPNTTVLADDERPEGRTLKISYSPIYNDQKLVEKLMFIVEDISDFELFYKEAKMDQLSYIFSKEIIKVENKKSLIEKLEQSIKISLDTLEDFLSPKARTYTPDYVLNSYKKSSEEIVQNVTDFSFLNKKIKKKLTEFDYTSIKGEQDYGNKDLTNLSYHIEATEIINDILEFLLIYSNVTKLFHTVNFSFTLENIIEDKVKELKSMLMDLFEKTFLVKTLGSINKDKLAEMSETAKTYRDFDSTMVLIRQRARFISLLLKAVDKADQSKTFSSMASLIRQLPSRDKITGTVLNNNLILPYKELLKLKN